MNLAFSNLQAIVMSENDPWQECAKVFTNPAKASRGVVCRDSVSPRGHDQVRKCLYINTFAPFRVAEFHQKLRDPRIGQKCLYIHTSWPGRAHVGSRSPYRQLHGSHLSDL